MQFDPIAPADTRIRSIRGDVLLALVLATLLSIGWTVTGWPRLRHLILPDTDDMMRLAQVRDWLGGQAFADWTQHRVAPPAGGAMHWSRINDLGIAAIILAATPLAGQHAAEVAAVLLYPALLFACHILLSARIARRLWPSGAGPIAAVLSALAYPGITIFAPGRIDHHALQTVAIEGIVLALTRTPGRGGGGIAGVLAAISLVIGLETAPQVAALTAVLFALWTVRGAAEAQRLLAFGIALIGTTALFLAFARPAYWPTNLCDAFTPASSTGTLAGGAALVALALGTAWLKDWPARAVTGIVAGGSALGLTLLAYPTCLSGPYGFVDPFLLKNFLPYIDEANSILALTPTARILSLGGLLAAGCIASVWMIARRPRRWPILLPVVSVIAMSALVTLVQARGTNIGAPATAPVLAGLVIAARRRRTWRAPAVIGAWAASTGVAYAQIPALAARVMPAAGPAAPATGPREACNAGDVWEQVDLYPAGIVMTGTNLASYVVGATHHATVGAGYHRQNRSTLAVYRYFLSPPARGADIARAWNVRYVAFCPGDFGEIDVTRTYPHSIATMLQSGRTPPGLERLPLRGARLRLYRVAGQ